MKKQSILVMALVCILSLSSQAQDSIPGRKGHGPKDGPKDGMRKEMKEKMSPKKRAGHIAVDLELTDAQRDKLQSLYEKEDAQREKQMTEMKKFHEQQKAKKEEMKKSHDAEMQKILGPEKYQQWKAQQTERHERMKKMMKDKRFGEGERRDGNRPEMRNSQRPPMPPKDSPEKMN